MHVKYSNNSSIGAIGVRVCRVKAVKTTGKSKQISWSAEKMRELPFAARLLLLQYDQLTHLLVGQHQLMQRLLHTAVRRTAATEVSYEAARPFHEIPGPRRGFLVFYK